MSEGNKCKALSNTFDLWLHFQEGKLKDIVGVPTSKVFVSTVYFLD